MFSGEFFRRSNRPITESDPVFEASGCFNKLSFVALLRNDNSAAFKRTCILVRWPVMKILKSLNHFRDHKRLSAGAHVKRVQQTSQSREKSHTERDREGGQGENDRREVSRPSSSSRLRSRCVSEDFLSPPEEGDFVLDGRTLVEWTLQRGQTGTTTQPENLMSVEPGGSR